MSLLKIKTKKDILGAIKRIVDNYLTEKQRKDLYVLMKALIKLEIDKAKTDCLFNKSKQKKLL